ncbi:hypothetical protein Fcan01_07272 [Folsomia candida]|uniref:Uncharacterized protein n=1 Tax=Folsomia candida TaxID=158441 RepID=A0A226EH47_FOLCA|nr:hypothetical protein Fcan01_07272 [Folsomia candida]
MLVIDLESFYGFCKLADTLAIKFLVDGVQNKNATASNSSLPPSTRQNYERKYHSQVKITSAGAATGPQKKLKKTPKIKERTKNNEKKQKKQVVSNRNAALSTKKNTTGEMARRLKNKALHFLTSYQESPSAFKHIARRKMRLMKNGSSANNPKVADRKNCIKALPAVDQGQNPGPVAAVRPRRKAYRAAELNMKVVIAHLKRPVRKEQED